MTVATTHAALAFGLSGAGIIYATQAILRPHLEAQVEDHDGYAVVSSRAGRLRLERDRADAVERFLADGAAGVADLGTDLARQLLLAGLAVPG